MKRRIVIVCNNSGGLYSFRNELITALIKQGYDVLAITPCDDMVDEIKEIGVRIINVPVDRRGINPKTDLTLFIKYYKLLKRIRPDIVITYTIKPNIYGGFACRLLKLPYAVNITGLGTAFEKDGLIKKLVISMYTAACKKAKVVFFENSSNRDTFVKNRITPMKQTKVLNGAGVNLEYFRYADYPKDDEQIRFLFIGRIMKEKGINELFNAMQLLRKDGVDCTLDVLGNYEENYEKPIREYEKQGWLRYHGYQKDVRPFIANCHCFVLPSYHEGMANTNLECAASGRPVITSSIPGCREAVINGVSGLLCESKSAESLYYVMKHFTALSAEQRKEMGTAGRRHMENVFDKEKVVKKTMTALELVR